MAAVPAGADDGDSHALCFFSPACQVGSSYSVGLGGILMGRAMSVQAVLKKEAGSA